jgi:lysophospholipase L1-like esterase
MIFRRITLLLVAVTVFSFWQCKNEPHPVQMGVDTCTSVALSDPGIFISRMPQPAFSLPNGGIPYGSKVVLHTDSLPAPGIYEISLDEGKTWKASECLSVTDTLSVWGRTRYKNIISPVSKASYTVFYQRVLIVGNSITLHGPLPERGWKGNWGMAASAAEKDYVHLLSTQLKKLNPAVDIRLMIAVDFEQNYRTYDFASLKSFSDFAPDLVIMRIAENTNLTTLNDYENRYARLITDLTSNNTNAKVICSTSFWKNSEEASYRIRNVARNRGYAIADLSDMFSDTSFNALSSFADTHVGIHPSDKGMKAIADKIKEHF